VFGLTITDPAFLVAEGGFSPASLPNLLAWWEADSFSLADGTAIGGVGNEWLDQSGGGNSLTQSTAGARPVFKTGIVNGKPVIRFDGTDDFLSMTSALTLGTAWTYMVVLSKATTGGGRISVGGSVNGHGFEHNAFDLKRMRVLSAAGSAQGDFIAAETTWKMANAIADIGGNTTAIYENKTSRGTGTEQTPTVNAVGQRSGGSFMNGDIAAIVIYSDNKSIADRDLVFDNYFQPKYAL